MEAEAEETGDLVVSQGKASISLNTEGSSLEKHGGP